MDCSGIADHLSPFVDGELEGDKAESVKAHLAKCPRCSASYQRYVKLKRLISEKHHLEKAPPRLKSAILGSVQSSGVDDFFYVLFAKLRAKPFLASAVAVTIFLAIFASVFLVMNSRRLPPLVREVLAHHAEGHRSSLKIVSDDAVVVAREMSAMLKRRVGVPDLRCRQCRLLGARQCPVCRMIGAEIRYVHPKGCVSLFVVPVASGQDIGELCKGHALTERRVDDRTYLCCKRNCGRVVLWWEGNDIYVVTSDLELESVLDIACEARRRLELQAQSRPLVVGRASDSRSEVPGRWCGLSGTSLPR